MLYTTRKKGTPGYEEIKSDIEKDFRVAKKNEIITKNLSGKTLDELALSESVKSSYKVEKTEMTKSLIKSLKGPMNPYSQNRKISEENYFIKGLYERASVIDNRKLLNLGIRN